MPITPLDIINCTPEEFFHQMVITKNMFKDTVVSYSRGSKHCITTLTELSAGNTVIRRTLSSGHQRKGKTSSQVCRPGHYVMTKSIG
jgi:hypothetical protein